MLLGKDSEIRQRSYDDNKDDPLMPQRVKYFVDQI